MNFVIKRVERWIELNEYEGLIYGCVDDMDVCAHALLLDPLDWEIVAPGRMIDADFWFERSGYVTRHEHPIERELREKGRAHYVLAGLVTERRTNEDIVVDSVFSLRIQLDPPRGQENHTYGLTTGDWVRIEGVLKFELMEHTDDVFQTK